MADKEKVIKLIEEEISVCESVNQCYRTIDLPALRDILALLKEQEAVEPIEEFVKGTHCHYYHCKRCGNIVGTILDDKHPIFPGVKLKNKHFCDVCGQAVKWE